jgi:hypothetical protein
MRVLFGRTNGEKTLGTVIKCNPAKAVIETLEPRGSTKPGTSWHVPYSMLEAFDETAQTTNTELAKEVGRLVASHGKQAVQIALLAHG